MEWFRSYHNKINDSVLSSLSNAEFGIYHKLECLAGMQQERGTIALNPQQKWYRNVASLLRLRPETCSKALTKFVELGLIEIDHENHLLTLTRWEHEQREWDDAAARMRRSRVKKSKPLRNTLRNRYVENRTEQNRETSPNVSRSDSVSSYPIDQGDQTTPSPVEAASPESHSDPGMDDILTMADKVAKKHDYQEAVEDTRACLNADYEKTTVYFALWHTLQYYKPKGSMTPRMYFRQELKERKK